MSLFRPRHADGDAEVSERKWGWFKRFCDSGGRPVKAKANLQDSYIKSYTLARIYCFFANSLHENRGQFLGLHARENARLQNYAGRLTGAKDLARRRRGGVGKYPLYKRFCVSGFENNVLSVIRWVF